MSYQVLARKWRPKTFAEVVGQQHVLTALANGLRENRLHHAYLFSGTRGVGKTSIARLFAKGLNCLTNGVTAEPCGHCENCRAIEQGNFIDLIEIDAASRTKVEDTRELLDNVQYKPVQGRYKVYLIDEVHMLSRHSFNALLKTLEEPPEYVKFLLATTDPHKLPITILSRCMQFHLKALEPQQIAQHLDFILREEKIPFDPLALDKLAKAAQGSIRDSLSLTDQAIAMGNGEVRSDVVNQMLGLIDESQPIEILYALQQGNGEKLMQAIEAVAQKAGDWDELLKDVAENLHQIAMQQLMPRANIDDASPIGFLAKHIAPQDVQFFYQIIVNGRKELALAPNRRVGAEMALLRALAFHPKHIEATPPIQTAAAPQNPTSAQNPSQPVAMPVISQAIKSGYQPEKSQSKAGLGNAQPVANPTQSTAPRSISAAAASALSALDDLDKIEKKKLELTSDQTETEKSGANLKSFSNQPALSRVPVRDLPPKVEPQTRSAQLLAQTQPNPQNAQQMESVVNENETENEDESEQELSGETYRWEWSNPELAQVDSGARPSDIKAALLQDITPELNARLIKLAVEQDPWSALIEESGVENLVKELALNTFILSQNAQQLILGLPAKQKHLNTPKTSATLQKALQKVLGEQLSVELQIVEATEQNTEQQTAEQQTEVQQTAIELRRQIYRELREQARHDISQDPKIKLLEKEFNAQLDLHSVKPV